MSTSNTRFCVDHLCWRASCRIPSDEENAIDLAQARCTGTPHHWRELSRSCNLSSAVNEYYPDRFITHLNIAEEARAKVTGRKAHSNNILRNVGQVKIIFAILQEKKQHYQTVCLLWRAVLEEEQVVPICRFKHTLCSSWFKRVLSAYPGLSNSETLT